MTSSPHMPDPETEHLLACYREARVILEYGSGGSTEMAAQMPGKLVISVETDRGWARELRQKIAAAKPVSQVVVQHVDIGPTGKWGRAVHDRKWQSYHHYPNAIWDAPFFRHPDVVLIDGRFRAACLMAVLLRISRPVTVLFDDYVERPKYHLVERVARPVRLIGRMAQFDLQAGQARDADIGFIISQFFQATFAKPGQADYSLSPQEEDMLRTIRTNPEEGIDQ